mmetsp:Transcript_8464/g.16652  ORF Transcript_8464/g.16652 Transcript_8464/m.16652 type:complete len:88 (-) Transcript_8464:292-555(-)
MYDDDKTEEDIFGSDVNLGMILMAVLVTFWVLLVGLWVVQSCFCQNWMLKQHGHTQQLLQENEKEHAAGGVPRDDKGDGCHPQYGAL